MLLLVAGADEEHPVQAARDLAGTGWPIQYEEFPGARHGEVWNTDRPRYDRALAGFLTRLRPRA